MDCSLVTANVRTQRTKEKRAKSARILVKYFGAEQKFLGESLLRSAQNTRLVRFSHT